MESTVLYEGGYVSSVCEEIMKDYYKIAKELGLDAKNTDFATLIDALIKKASDAQKGNQGLVEQLKLGNKLIKTLRMQLQELIEKQDKLVQAKTEVKRENERLCQLIDNPR